MIHHSEAGILALEGTGVLSKMNVIRMENSNFKVNDVRTAEGLLALDSEPVVAVVVGEGEHAPYHSRHGVRLVAPVCHHVRGLTEQQLACSCKENDRWNL